MAFIFFMDEIFSILKFLFNLYCGTEILKGWVFWYIDRPIINITAHWFSIILHIHTNVIQYTAAFFMEQLTNEHIFYSLLNEDLIIHTFSRNGTFLTHTDMILPR